MAMSAPLQITDGCCQPACSDQVVVEIPGPPGPPGNNGTDGTDGVNAFTTTAANFTQPAIAGSVAVTVADSAWAANGQVVFVSTGGYYRVTGIPDSTHLTLTNLGYTGNAAPATNIVFPQQVSPGGLQGTAGSAPSVTLNDLSPTTTKGDIIVDNGANNPNASDVRLAVGTDGKSLVADSAQPTGLNYARITPNTAAADNNVPRFDGTSGTPMPLQDSKLNITDTGAVRASGSGGNARGSDAVDLQVNRSAATQVASGDTSVIGGGVDNSATGTSSVVSGGDTNTASGSTSTIAGGFNNTASGNGSTVGAGASNVASGTSSFVGAGNSNQATATNASVVAGASNLASANNSSVGGGTNNEASGVGATVAGGIANTASAISSSVVGGVQALADKYGQIAHSSGAFVTAGDSQLSELIWRIATSNATPTEAFLDGASARATIAINSVWGGKIIIVGRSSAGVCAVWEAVFGIQNNANTVSLVDTPVVTVLADGTGATWGVTGAISVTADNVNKALALTFTGAAATNIRWTAHASFVQVAF